MLSSWISLAWIASDYNVVAERRKLSAKWQVRAFWVGPTVLYKFYVSDESRSPAYGHLLPADTSYKLPSHGPLRLITSRSPLPCQKRSAKGGGCPISRFQPPAHTASSPSEDTCAITGGPPQCWSCLHRQQIRMMHLWSSVQWHISFFCNWSDEHLIDFDKNIFF